MGNRIDSFVKKLMGDPSNKIQLFLVWAIWLTTAFVAIVETKVGLKWFGVAVGAAFASVESSSIIRGMMLQRWPKQGHWIALLLITPFVMIVLTALTYFVWRYGPLQITVV